MLAVTNGPAAPGPPGATNRRLANDLHGSLLLRTEHLDLALEELNTLVKRLVWATGESADTHLEEKCNAATVVFEVLSTSAAYTWKYDACAANPTSKAVLRSPSAAPAR